MGPCRLAGAWPILRVVSAERAASVGTVFFGPSRAHIHILRVFDELIQNRDRNAGNVLWTKDWTMWMIDHPRAFRTGHELLRPDLLRAGVAAGAVDRRGPCRCTPP